MPSQHSQTNRSPWLRRLALIAAVPLLALLQGCITTALIIASQVELPPSCASFSTAEQAMMPRCGGYKSGMLVTKDVNTPFRSECPLTNFASQTDTWQGLPELLAKGARPELCNKAPLVAMAEAQACPDFAAMTAETQRAVRWLALGDAASVSGPVLHMLSCPSAKQAGFSDLITTWVAQQALAPSQVRFSALSAVHPSSLREPWVALLLASGHQAQLAAEQDASAYERALRQGDVATLRWWTQQAPALIQRVPSKGVGYVAWLPLARLMNPGFAVDDAARQRSLDLLLALGANPNAALPHDRGETVLTYARRLQPQLAEQMRNASAAAPSGASTASKLQQVVSAPVTLANLD